ncbi:MAG: lamin tail domain-containing protein [Candidatus Pacebacteria bacterium]|nr:lamin tail domain-containing protein [Candidatus Paceibacterota bacterium]
MLKILIFLFFPLPVFSLLITEVQIAGDLSDNDYIKIYNSQNYSIDISDFKLRKRTSTGAESSIRVLPKQTILAPKEYFLWANSKNDFHLEIKANTQSTAYLSKNNSIALLDNKNNVLDSLSWGKVENPFEDNDNFEINPEKNQRIKRKKQGLEYQNTGNKNNDFYLFSEKEKQENFIAPKINKPEIKYNKAPFLSAFFLSLFSSLVILGLKKLT